jgi:hypothetical protein
MELTGKVQSWHDQLPPDVGPAGPPGPPGAPGPSPAARRPGGRTAGRLVEAWAVVWGWPTSGCVRG